ncbi:MAG: hypothetical protein JNK25_06520 [Phycisphaerae bacterium]|nr:hypothetical protein [Phycisphaerae bacterium]
MSLPPGLRRVDRAHPCPICGKPDWCLIAVDYPPSRAFCQRIPSGTRCGEAGFLHWLTPRGSAPSRTRDFIVPAPKPSDPRFGETMLAFQSAACRCALGGFADRLGVSIRSLERLGVGRAPGAWAFPMRDATGRIIGIRTRPDSGGKFCLRDSRLGLFVPDGLEQGGTLLIAEGESDTAALLTLGFAAIGRPGCGNGTKMMCELVARLHPAMVVIISDSDKPGLRGADVLARALTVRCRDVRVVVPPSPHKDARAWANGGASHDEIVAAIQSAAPRRLIVSVRSGGKS